MPQLDGDERVVGCAARETPSTGYYIRFYLVLDFRSHKLRMYPEEAEHTPIDGPPDVEINCQYITKVRASLARPKTLNSLEIVTTSGSHFLSVDSVEERDQWMESLKKASMRQGSAKQVTSLIHQKQSNVSYQTKIVGGVVQKTPIQTSGDGVVKDGAAGVDARGGQGFGAGVGERRTRGFPRIIKAGHGTKLGHVRKSWKRRFFVLTEIALGYYKTIEEVEPIRAVPLAEISAVQLTIESGKDMMEVITPSRTFLVQFDTVKEKDEWVEAFRELLGTIKPQQDPSTYTHTQITASPSSTSPTDTLSLENEHGTLV